MRLILAEKPSVAMLIAKATNCSDKHNGFILGDDYIVTWAFGHLLTLYDLNDYKNIKGTNTDSSTWQLSDYPFIPTEFRYKPISSTSYKGKKASTAKQQLDIIKQLVDSKYVTDIIIATDYDREGQVIADSILNYINNQKPEYRLLLNDWTEQAIQQGLQNLIPNSQMKNLSEAGFCRQHADWLFGINWTSTATLTFNLHNLFNVGRVILPTLKILYDRKLEQDEFEEVTYYELTAKDLAPPTEASIVLKYFEDGSSIFYDKSYLTSIMQKLNIHGPIISSYECSNQKVYAPPLFNLTGLQTTILNKYNGWTSDKVLKVCQQLYEKQYITYPRTESCYLDESSIGKTKGILTSLCNNLEDEELKNKIQFKGGKSLFDNSKIHAHGAIIPTYKIPVQLNEQEQIIYKEILLRFLSKFMPPAEYEKIDIIASTHTGELRGSTSLLRVPGWKMLYGQEADTQILEKYTVGTMLDHLKMELCEDITEPPKSHTEASLLKVMETCGKNVTDTSILEGYSIGTPATRAGIIKKLKDTAYVLTHGKFLEISDKGKYLINHFPLASLFDLSFTGSMEKKLSDVAKGEVDPKVLEKEFTDLMVSGVDYLKRAKGRQYIGKCPICGEPIIDGPRGYGCLGYINGCNFMFSKQEMDNYVGAEIPDEVYKELFAEGKSSNQVALEFPSYTMLLSYCIEDNDICFDKKIE